MSVTLAGPSLAWEQSDWVARWQSGWRDLPAGQQPDWPEPAHLRRVTARLSGAPCLVTAEEIVRLRATLAQVAFGRGFVVQAGDCAETLDTPDPARIGAGAALWARVARLLEDRLAVPVTTIGRIAGQYAKPRSSAVEVVGGQPLPVFRGFNVNAPGPTAADRRPDPARLLRAYRHSSATMALLRGIVRQPWISHEALLLDYEEAFLRPDPATGGWYLGSTHLPWIGARTNDPAHAHVRFLAGVGNPVGCKIGPDTTPETLLRLCDRLDPEARPGRLVLITRMGARLIERRLPPLVAAVARSGHPVVWMCDPMHGNTYRASCGRKVRHVDTIAAELSSFLRILRAAGAWPGGVHIEAVAGPVTECVGGLRRPIGEKDLDVAYETACDPRLNYDQTVEFMEALASK